MRQTTFSRIDGSSNYQSLYVSRVSGIYDDNGTIHQMVAEDRKSRREMRETSSYAEYYLIVIYAKRPRDQGKGKSRHLSAISRVGIEDVRVYDWFKGKLIRDNYHRVEL